METLTEIITPGAGDSVELIEHAVESSRYFYIKLGIVVLIIAVCVLLFLVISRSYFKYIDKLKKDGSFRQSGSNKTHMGYLILRILLIAIPIVSVIAIYKIDMAHILYFLLLIVIFGGISFQDSAKDFVMGLRILLEHFYRIGDVVEYEGVVGQVISFSFMTTKIQNIYDNSVMSISNRNISQIVRWGNQFDIDLGLSYDEDIDYVFETLKDIADMISMNKNVDDCKFLGLQEFAASTIIYRIRVFAHPEVFALAQREANYIIRINLLQSNIEIPYNQIDVHHYGESVVSKAFGE